MLETQATTRRRGKVAKDQDFCVLSRSATRNLIAQFILDEQRKLVDQGHPVPTDAREMLLLQTDEKAIEALSIDEDGAGFDSLARLDLVMRLNRFFNLSTSGIEDYLLIRRTVGDWVDLVMQHFSMMGDKSEISFATSGSTGVPKCITHSLEKLKTEAEGFIETHPGLFAKSASVLAIVPPHHIYGFLFSALIPSLTGTETVALQNLSPTSALSKARAGDVIVATPYRWRQLAKSGGRFTEGVHGICSAGPSDAESWSVVERANLQSLTEVYGATETGGIGTRQTYAEPFRLLPHLIPCNGLIFHGTSRNAPVPVQDNLQWTGPDTFQVLGRLDDIVEVAGVNVSPTYVSRLISEVEGVAAAAVRLDRGRLKAFVVPQQAGGIDLRFAIQRHLTAKLPPPARPTAIRFGKALPRDAMGKLVDWAKTEHGSD